MIKVGNSNTIVAQKRGAMMIKEKDRIINEKTEKIAQLVRNYVNEIDTLSETENFTIDMIEKIWGKLDESTKDIYEEIGREIIEQIDERKMIRLKKANMRRKG